MNEKENIREELKDIAPLLAQETCTTPFSVPHGYFEQLTERLTEKATKDSTDKVFIFRVQRWKKLAAAAVLAGIIVSSLYMYRQSTSPDINKNPEGWVKKEINAVSDEKLNSFVTLTNSFDSLRENSAETALHQQEVSSLTKDISDDEIQALLSEISQPDLPEAINE
jgi:hypothetical protein